MKQDSLYRTAESVSPGHPDKLCDQISDAILDAHLSADPDARVAAEVCGGHGTVFVTGEITSRAHVDVEAIVHRLAGSDVQIIINLVEQSPEISRGVDTGGAGDQGIMIGYATAETPELLPLEVVLSRRLNQKIYEQYPFDGKTQVTISTSLPQPTTSNGKSRAATATPSSQPTAFDNNTQTTIPTSSLQPATSNDKFQATAPASPLQPTTFTINSIVASFQNTTNAALQTIIDDFLNELDLSTYHLDLSVAPTFHLNPAGEWHLGGFTADTGLTGRKLIVDNYGPRVPIGGGCFSGKDPSKVDRSAAYMARRIAVDYLRQTPNAQEVFVRLAYAIGRAEPLEQTVIIDQHAEQITGYDLTPQGIITALDLRRPIYEPTARYGHFGEGFPWDN